MKLFKLVLASTVLLLGNAAQAALVEVGTTNHDTVTGYVWYDMTATTGISYNQMLANFSNSDSAFYGYRYGTKAEITTLATNSGSLLAMFNAFGQTGINCCARSDGFYNDGTANSRVGQAYLIPSIFTTVQFLTDFASPDAINWVGLPENLVGSWILKSEAPNVVPEPGSIALLAGGALAALLRRRKSSRAVNA